MTPIYAGVFCSLFVLVPVDAAVAHQLDVHLAQASGGVRPYPSASEGAIARPPPATRGEPPAGANDADAAAPVGSLEDKLAGFVTNFYLTGETRSRSDLEELYADTVEYFESGQLSRARVLRDKQAYFTKWPRRTYTLLRDTLQAQWRPGIGKILDVTFDYEFDVASSARRSRGRGRSALTLDLTLDGGRITREQGAVTQRW